jgi:hypothetical protein
VTWHAQQIFCVLIISARWNSTVVFASIWGKHGSWHAGHRSWTRTEFCGLLAWWGASWRNGPPLTLCVALKPSFFRVGIWTLTIRRISWPNIPR